MSEKLNQTARRQAWGLGLLRVVVGTIFVAHGAQKLFSFGLEGTAAFFSQLGLPLPGVAAGLVIAAEFVGGALLLVGLFTRLAAVPVAVTMVVAILTVHLPAGFFAPEGIEFPLALLAGSVALALAGPGAWALDHVLRPGRPEAVNAPTASREQELRKVA